MKVDGGILELILREIEVECLPGDIPERIEVEVSDLGINGALRVSDLRLPAKVKILEGAEQVVVHVVSVKEEAAADAWSRRSRRRRSCCDSFGARGRQEGQEGRRSSSCASSSACENRCGLLSGSAIRAKSTRRRITMSAFVLSERIADRQTFASGSDAVRHWFPARITFGGQLRGLVMPQTYMNNSGRVAGGFRAI